MSEGAPPSPLSPARARRALAFVLVTVLLDVIGIGIIIPVMPELLMELSGEGLDRAAVIGGWLMFLYAFMQFVFAPVLGNLSDRFGRRPVLLFSLLAFGLDYVLMGFAPTLTWLFVGRAIAGVAGATTSTANAFIADVSPPEKRAANFGLIGAVWGLGFILGPVIGGLLGDFGPRVPFFAAAGLALANVVYGFFVLPETLAPELRRPFDWRRANPLGALAQMRRFPMVLGVFAVLVLYQVAHDANPATWTYYTMLKFGWTERDVGFSMGVVGLAIAVVQGGLIRAAIPKLGERLSALAGLLLMAVGYLGFAFAAEGWIMLAFIVPFALGGLAMPAIMGILANEVRDDMQGELQGAATSIRSLTAIVAPLLLTQVFGVFTADDAPVYFPGAAFLLAGALTALAAVVFAWRTRPPRSADQMRKSSALSTSK